jgi:hypothetical protein
MKSVKQEVLHQEVARAGKTHLKANSKAWYQAERKLWHPVWELIWNGVRLHVKFKAEDLLRVSED